MLHKVEEVWRKNAFYDELKCEWDMHSADDSIMCLCDINGHIDGLGRMHGGHGVGQRIFEGRML